MPNITLPDGKKIKFDKKVSGIEISEKISKSLSKQALVMSVDGNLKDLSFIIENDSKVKIFTSKDAEGLETIRHDTAHILAMAVQELFPGTQVTIGPVIENGFYYDFARKDPFTENDLKKIENKMKEIVERDELTRFEVWDRDKAIEHFKKIGENYKAEIIKDIPHGEKISIYFHGKWHDLCRGPHLLSTAKIGKFFKLTKVAGAYWRGDSNNEMLQRIYGTSWASQKELDDYLKRIEEAEKRDHRKLGKEMDLFHFREESPGAVFWHDKGWALFQKLVSYMRVKQENAEYKEINTPEILDRSLWEKSGHWEKFGENMYTSTTPDEKVFAIKPMNCPGCVQVYNQGLKSYRDLPLKMSEFGKVHRYEPSGALHGLLRVRAFTQDDAHIFCTPDQIKQEISILINTIKDIYNKFGFDDLKIELSTRPDKRVGSDEIWDKAESSLIEALEANNIEYLENPGDGAFYGPKIDFSLKDSLSRVWQLGTIQLDFSMPGRLEASYVDKEGNKDVPVMIHRAILGSLERFVGILIEHYSGNLPVWLSPVQVMTLNITDKHRSYAEEINSKLLDYGIRSECDSSNEKISYKIRNHAITRVPYMVIVGDKELENQMISVRDRSGSDLGSLQLEEFVDLLKKNI